MSRTPLFWKLYPSFFLVTVVSLLLAGWLVSGTVRTAHMEGVREDLEAKARLVALHPAVTGDRAGGRVELQAWCQATGRRIGTRITVIRPDGSVICDSAHDPGTMDNHADRPEVRAALGGHVGSSVRYSHTLRTRMMYVAVPTGEGPTLRVVRAAMPLDAVERALRQLLHRVVVAGIIGALVAAVLCFVVSRRISRPLEELTREVQEFPAGSPGRDIRVSAAPSREFAILAREVLRAERVRRDFVANVSHELKTPITAIRGFTETLLEGALEDPEAARRFLAIIRDNTERMERIVQDLLALARLEQVEGTALPADVSVPLARVAEAAVHACSTAAREHGIRVEVDVPEDLACRGDASLLERALVNLVDNAIKYSEPGRPVVVRGRREGREVVLEVEDRGCGVAPEHLPRIFERFYRVDRARSRKLGGTGLGLAIVKHVAQVHGGRVEVDSAPGRGSTFRLRLPAA